MNCRDFSEIADSYLSNELLVETNHEVIRHLESCAGCRSLLAERRAFRDRLKRAISDARDSHVDTAFAAKLRESLQSTAQPRSLFAGFRLAFAAAAVLLMTIVGVVIYRSVGDPALESAVNSAVPEPIASVPAPLSVVPIALKTASVEAFGDHKNCALSHNLKERPISLAKAAETVDVVNRDFDKTVMDALKEKFGGDVEMIKAHYCLFNGRYFAHAVVSLRKRTISVLMTKLSADEVSSYEPAACGSDGDLNAACFSSGGYGVFVVSDAGEDEAVTVALSLSDVLGRHIARTKASI
jgi:hypothetical protein